MSNTKLTNLTYCHILSGMTYKRIYVNAKALIDFFDGGTELSRLFDKYNFEPVNRNTIYKWTNRGAIPVERWLQIEHIAIKEGTYVAMRKQCIVTYEPPQDFQEHPSSEEGLL